MKTYKSISGSWPSKVLSYLEQHGESKKIDIQNSIGMTVEMKHCFYQDRPGYYLDVVLRRLKARNKVVSTKRGFYKLAFESTKLF